jgi:glycosyltransferase involved in cell wall biosynthesis
MLRQLARRHEVVLLCPGPLSRDAAQALRFCAGLEVVPPGRSRRPWWEHLRGLAGALPASVCLSSDAMAIRLRELVRAQRFDIVQIEFLGLAHFARLLPSGPRKVLVEHCITSELRARLLRLMPWGARRLYYAVDLLKLRYYERAAMETFDACVTVSSRDERQIRAWVPGLDVATIPNGVDTDYFRPFGQEQPHSLLFIGAFDLEYANVDAVLQFARDILPLIRRRVPDAVLTVVGPAPPRAVLDLAQNPGIEVTGRVEDIRPYLARAALVILPLRGGAGTKIRIFTAMSMQKAVLASSLAVEGIDAATGEEIAIADGPERFAAEAISLLTDAPRRLRIGRAARARAVAQYDWRTLGQKLDDFYASLLHGVDGRQDEGLSDAAGRPRERSATCGAVRGNRR